MGCVVIDFWTRWHNARRVRFFIDFLAEHFGDNPEWDNF